MDATVPDVSADTVFTTPLNFAGLALLAALALARNGSACRAVLWRRARRP